MYAYGLDIGGRFFEGVCAYGNATAHSCDPPPAFNRELTLAIAGCSKDEQGR
jgi:hypothetical protein